jgi:hypothetical protein
VIADLMALELIGSGMGRLLEGSKVFDLHQTIR